MFVYITESLVVFCNYEQAPAKKGLKGTGIASHYLFATSSTKEPVRIC